MRILVNKKAVSTFGLIILVLCSAILGGLMSYILVMSNYFNMPEDATMLIVTDAVFPITNASYFNVTILNPSNSASDVTITAIRLSVEGKTDVYYVSATEPESLPFLMERGTKQTFKCLRNWSDFAGEIVRIEPIAANSSTKSPSYATPRVKLKLTPTFDETISVEYFNLTVENSQESVLNLTLSEIMIFGVSISDNVTPPLIPSTVLSPGQRADFRCNYRWENLKGINATITVKTLEGYESAYTTGALKGAILNINTVAFDYTDSTRFYVNISSSEESTATVSIKGMNLTLLDGTTVVINETLPQIGEPSIFNSVFKNQSKTFTCTWNWTEHRYEVVYVYAYTNEGFTIPTVTVTTPTAIVWNITNVEFDLDYLEHFLVSVENMPCSLQAINVTKIMLNETEATLDLPFTVLNSSAQATFNCTLPWGGLRGTNVTLTVVTENGLNISRIITVSPVGLKLVDKSGLIESLVRHINITVANSNNSLQNVTITRIVFETEDGTYEIDGTLTNPSLVPDGYILKVGEGVMIVCPWNWFLYSRYRLTVTVYTKEGFHVSRTWYP